MKSISRSEIIDFLSLAARFAAFKLTEKKYDIDYLPGTNQTDKFVSARQAAQMINDNDTVFSSGVAAHCRCSIFYWALRDRYIEQAKPKMLTWITSAGHGGRGKAPGTIEEIAIPGLMSEYICSHVESAKAQLMMADNGDLDIHTIPYGEISFLLEAQARGEKGFFSTTGIGTFLDPHFQGTTAVKKGSDKNYVRREGDLLHYQMPYIDVALLVAPYADEDGNIYFTDAACLTDHVEAANAAYASGGKVIVAVSAIIPKDHERISIPSEIVTAIIVNPWNEQTGGIRQKKHLPIFTAGGNEDIDLGIRRVRMINKITGITSKRGKMDEAITRTAAWLFTQKAKPGDLINMGVGIPEEVGRLLYEHSIHGLYKFSTEAGALGGIPASGVYFGAALNPEKLTSSAWMFRHYENNLSVAVFGFLQVNSQGDVNVSRRGSSVKDYVGPGGLINIAESAKTIIFVGHWMAGAKYSIKKGKLFIRKKGKPKLVDQLKETTFSANRAISKGKQVYYVTSVGIFRLTENGLELIYLMPGIDIEKDIINGSTASFIIPEGMKTPQIPEAVLTGRSFSLSPKDYL